MPQINDGKVAATVGPDYHSGLLAYFLFNGARSDDFGDAQHEFLVTQGVAPKHINDMWEDFFIAQGYSGSLSDMAYTFWVTDGGVIFPP